MSAPSSAIATASDTPAVTPSLTWPERPPVVLILAAGAGERFRAAGGAQHKLQAPFVREGVTRTVLEHVVATAQASGLPWHVVSAEATAHHSVQGMGTSIATGVAATPEAGGFDQLKLNDDEVAMIMGHEMAHALREHARERLAKTQATGMGLSIASQLLGLGSLGDAAANLGTQLLSLKYSRDDETEADLVGLEIAARGGYRPEASVALWQKMMAASGNGGPNFLSTHPSGSNRIQELQANLPKVQHLFEQARRQG